MKTRHEHQKEALAYILRTAEWYEADTDQIQWDTGYAVSFVIDFYDIEDYRLIRLVGDETGGISREHEYPVAFTDIESAKLWAYIEQAKEEAEWAHSEDQALQWYAEQDHPTDRDELPYETPEGEYA